MAAALARLLGAQGQQVEDRVAGVHEAVAARVFSALGPLGLGSQQAHDLVAGTVHGTLRAAFGGAGRLGGLVAARVPDEVLLASPRGRTLVGAVLGLIGDAVIDEEPDLAWPTVLLEAGEARSGRSAQVVASAAGPRADPTAADEVVVLLHGLCETELAWRIGAGPGRPALPEVLARPGREVLLARMNTGVRASRLGDEVAALLEQCSGDARVVLVGHSLGGLVARAALRHGTARGQGWVARCDALVTLGTPHHGAPLEKAVEVLVRAGGLAPEVDAIVRWFDQRSAGIRDLRHGVDDDADEPGVPVLAAPLPGHVRLHTVGAALPGLRGTLFGDGLVHPRSAHGRGLRRPLHARRGEVLDIVGGHFDLVSDPRVTAHVAALVDAVSSPALERA